MGYAQNAKGFRIYIPEKNDVIISRDVKVIEKMYYDNTDDQSYEDLFDELEPLKPETENKVIKKTKKNKQTKRQIVEIEILPTNLEKQVTPEKPAQNDLLITTSDKNEDEVEGGEQSTVDQDRRSTHEVTNTRPVRENRPPNWFKDYDMDSKSGSSSEDFHSTSSLILDNSEDYLTFLCESEEPNINDVEWREAIKKEIRAHIKNGTWIIKTKDKEENIVDFKMILKNKGDIKKTRLVARGFTQRPGIDYNETWAPVAKLSSIKLLLATAVNEKLKLHQLGVTTAYLNGDLEEKIIMKMPEYLEEYITEIMVEESSNEDSNIFNRAKKMLLDMKNTKGEKVCELKKSLYGLKQSGRQWYKKLHSELKSLGFIPSEADPCIYTLEKGGEKILLGLYVDDILLAYSCKKILGEVIKELTEKFEMKDLGVAKDYVGIEIEQNEGQIKLKQEKYIKNLLTRFGMVDCKSTNTPIEPYLKLQKEGLQIKTYLTRISSVR